MSNNSKKGFTLLEVLIAVGILVVAVGAAAGTAVMAINSGTYNRDRTIAENLARREIERTRTMRESDYLDDDNNTGWDVNNSIDEGGTNGQNKRTRVQSDGNYSFIGGVKETTINGQTFRVKTEVFKVRNNINGDDNGETGETDYVNENLNMRRVVVTVLWNEAFLVGDRNVKLVTYITNNK
jgi:prepilin-type N-terminal cleavage/methylation domain-containing protein